MVSIKTGVLKAQADVLSEEAHHYNYIFSKMDECISWLKRQEFNEANEIYRILTYQYDELQEQKKELLLLSEVTKRIGDKYDKTEKTIIECGESCQKLKGHVYSVNLNSVRNMLFESGLHMAE